MKSMTLKSVRISASGETSGIGGRWVTSNPEDSFFDSKKEALAYIHGVEAVALGLEIESLEFQIDVFCSMAGDTYTVDLYGASAKAALLFLEHFEE
jgi:hypothetical protein